MAKGFKRVPYKALLNTSGQGSVRTTYHKLVSVFGKPKKGDGYKTEAEWDLMFSDGTVASIYDWKEGKHYLGKQGKPVSKITDWHIGGKSKHAIALVKAALREKA